jgi:hypothetical protein
MCGRSRNVEMLSKGKGCVEEIESAFAIASASLFLLPVAQ